MNRRHLLLTAPLATAGIVLPRALFAAHDGKIGTHSADEWAQLNREAGAKIEEIKPDSADLTVGDQQLVLDLATGGMLQLELSRIALVKADSAEVKAYAQAEVIEQTGLTGKLKEVAGAKGLALPEIPDQEMQKALDELSEKSGADFDEAYLKKSGIEGHETLALTMGKVQADADDVALKQIAAVALPLIALHLQAARDEMKDKS